MTRQLRYVLFVLLMVVLAWALPTAAQNGAKNGEWRAYAGEIGSTRYSPLDQINRENVKNLQVAWSWRFDNFGAPTSETTPIMVNGVLYFTVGPHRTVVAANPGTGETLWIYRPDEGVRFDQAPRKNTRGVGYWTDGADSRIITVTPGFQLMALNAKSGAPIPSFGKNGVVDLFEQIDLDFKGDPIGKIGNSSPPLVSNDVIVVGPAHIPGSTVNKANVKGDVTAFDVRTGKRLWIFHTIPRKGEPGYETWLNGSAEYTGNAGVWGPMSADEQLGYVYLNIEAPTNDVYGGHRPGNNLYGNSLVCLDIKTGKMIWYRQLVHHDIWDYDLPPHPILLDLNVNGRTVKVLVQLSKQAFAYVLDRTNGQPVWPMEERPVGKSDVPGEWTSPTQPFPTKPPGFDVQGVRVDDLIDYTPDLKRQALEFISQYRIGPIYTPPSVVNGPDGKKGTISAPLGGGGANWQSGASDPETGFVYVGSTTSPGVAGLNKNDPSQGPVDSDYTWGRGDLTIQGLPLLKPPYGRITAYDMNKGEIAWQIPNGDAPQNFKNAAARLGITLPRTGNQSPAGLLVTKTLLFAGEGAGGYSLLHAYDKKTGANIAEIPMPGSQSAVPMTYMYQGRQFVLMAVGPGGQQTSGQIVAFAIPAAAGDGARGGGRGGGGRGQQ